MISSFWNKKPDITGLLNTRKGNAEHKKTPPHWGVFGVQHEGGWQGVSKHRKTPRHGVFLVFNMRESQQKQKTHVSLVFDWVRVAGSRWTQKHGNVGIHVSSGNKIKTMVAYLVLVLTPSLPIPSLCCPSRISSKEGQLILIMKKPFSISHFERRGRECILMEKTPPLSRVLSKGEGHM